MNSTVPGVNNLNLVNAIATAELDALTRGAARGLTLDSAVALTVSAKAAFARIVELMDGVDL